MKLLPSLLLSLCLASSLAHADIEVGNAAPVFDAVSVDGKVISGRQLQGRVVIHLFWATWCPICTADLPDYARLHATYKARGLEVLAISLDDNRHEVVDFWHRHSYSFPATMRSDEMRQDFGRITGTPTVYIVDRAGKVRQKHLGSMSFDELERSIKPLL